MFNNLYKQYSTEVLHCQPFSAYASKLFSMLAVTFQRPLLGESTTMVFGLTLATVPTTERPPRPVNVTASPMLNERADCFANQVCCSLTASMIWLSSSRSALWIAVTADCTVFI